MSDLNYISGSPISAEQIPAGLVDRVGPSAPRGAKLAIARAVLPMPADQLCVALGVLSRDEDQEVAKAAEQSLEELDAEVVVGLAGSELPAAVLDVFARLLRRRSRLLITLVNNHATADDTVRWMARNLRGDALQHIARSQARYLREPRIIEALIVNPATPTPTLAPVVETAIRADIDTTSIPGFRQLADAFYADLQEERRRREELEAGEGGEEDIDPDAPDAFTQEQEGTDPEGVPDAVLETMLGADEDADEVEPADLELEDEQGHQSLRATIASMTVAQKVRLALMGDAVARGLLVRDPKKAVSIAVMKSPRLTEKEVANFAQNKTIGDDVIRSIASSREWTRNYAVRFALVRNPKCPPSQALSFIANLRQRDVMQLARAKDVPAYVSRAARQMVQKRAQRT